MPVLRNYQTEGAEWLARSAARVGLFDDTGLGKTATAIRGAQLVAARYVLVLSPSIVLWNWRREFETWWPEAGAAVQIVDSTRAKLDLTDRGGLCVVICTHGLTLVDGIAEQLRGTVWDVLIVDEAHAFRGPTAKRAHGLYRLTDDPCSPLVEQCLRVWLLTATPMPNNNSELWTHIRGLWPEVLVAGAKSWGGFVHRFCRTRQTLYGLKVIGNKNLAELRGMLRGRFLRRLKKNVQRELPPIVHQTLPLSPKTVPWELRELEERIKPKVLATLKKDAGDGVEPEHAWRMLREAEDYSRFRQLCGLAKVGAVVELLADELETNAIKRVIVFAHHTEVVEGIAAGLKKFHPVTVTGAVSARERALRVDRFQTDPRCRVFCGNILAAGVGATLTAACEVVFAEMSDVPGDNKQAADRSHRMGQTQSVRVRFVSLAGTVDEQLVANLRNKMRMVREVLK